MERWDLSKVKVWGLIPCQIMGNALLSITHTLIVMAFCIFYRSKCNLFLFLVFLCDFHRVWGLIYFALMNYVEISEYFLFFFHVCYILSFSSTAKSSICFRFSKSSENDMRINLAISAAFVSNLLMFLCENPMHFVISCDMLGQGSH